MYKKILVPLDGSELAEVSLPYAEEFSAEFGSEIILLYLSRTENNPYYNVRKIYMEKTVKATEDEVKKLSKKTDADAIKVSSAMLTGNVAEEIVKYADQEDVSLILMATHGQSGMKQWAMGSIATKVMSATKRPVILIRARDAKPAIRNIGGIRKIVIPLDGSSESEQVIPHIAQLAATLKAEVVLFQAISLAYPTYTADAFAYVTYSDNQTDAMKASALDYLAKTGATLKEKGVKTSYEVRFGSAADEIINFSDEINADLVAMTTHGRSGLGRWLFGSTAARILKGGNSNLLIVIIQS